MPTPSVIQPSFAAGELSPFLYARVDLAKFHVGCRQLLNMFVHPAGGASNRPGTLFVGAVDDSTIRHRGIPFQFRTSPAGQTYGLIFGNLTMQVVMNGGFVLLPTKTITGATQANPGVITAVAHGYSTGTRVPIASVVGMTQLNGNTYTITVVDADHFSIGVDTTAFTAYSSGGTAGGGIFTMVSPYASADLPTLKFVQSADTMTLTHPGYASRDLTRTGHAAWTFTIIVFAPKTAAPTGLVSSSPAAGNDYAVTAVDDTTGEESLQSATASSNITTSTLTWTPVANCSSYNMYRSRNGLFGFIGQGGIVAGVGTFTDTTVLPDVSNTPPGARNPFGSAGNWPACATYYLQRKVFGGTTNNPQTLVFSGTGSFNNMNVSQPTKDDDAITRTLVSKQVNEIRHFVPGQSMLVMTSGAEWRCYPGSTGTSLTPAACATLPQTAYGSSHTPPLQIGYNILFIQERGSRVREMAYDALRDNYTATDMSILSSHLFYDTGAQYDVQEWCYAQEPFQIAWCVRSDGILLGFTYMKEQDVYAWHRHTTDGVVESVFSIAEGKVDAVYMIVARTIGGVTKRYVERMAERVFTTIADAWFVDCGLQYSGVPVTSVSGLGHLEGKTVAILGDGSVMPSQVVTGGAVTLDGPYSKVTVGLPYESDLESLNLEVSGGGGTIQGQMKKIAQVTVRVKDARGLQVGIAQTLQRGVSGAYTTEVKQRQTEILGTPMLPFTGDFALKIPTEWSLDGRLFCRQTYPLPVTILALIPEVAVGD